MIRGHRSALAAVAQSIALVPAALLMWTGTAPVAAATSGPSPAAIAGEPWWVRAGYAGRRVDGLREGAPGGIGVRVNGTWQELAVPTPAGSPPRSPVSSPPPGDSVGEGGPPLRPGWYAEPASLPGVVVAVAADGAVWRRGRDRGWARAFLLLPRGGFAGPPPVSAIAAFDTPITGAVYLGIDGYGVLVSTNGGDDWLRAGAGLPDHVLALRADTALRGVFAATDDGLWVHHPQPFPRPPAYAPEELRGRIAGTAVLTVLAVVLGLLALRRLAPRGVPPGSVAGASSSEREMA